MVAKVPVSLFLDSAGTIPILYTDDYLSIVHKPSGMLVHRGQGAQSSEEFLLQRVRDQLGRWLYPLHRLDRPTSGLVVFAHDSQINRELQQQWIKGIVKKTYLAIVRGYLLGDGDCQDALDDPDNGAIRDARTKWKNLDQCAIPLPVGPYLESRYSLIECMPTTGRWHQIRRHLSRIAHPIIGDTSHGDRHHNHVMQQIFSCQRLLLAASKFSFIHPVSQQLMEIEDDYERGLWPLWNKVCKWDRSSQVV